MPQDFQKGKEVNEIPFSDRVVYPEAAVTLKPHERYVYAQTTAAGVAFTVTLPRPELMPGETVSVYMVARNSTKDITVAGEGFSDITLDAADEFTVLLSIGKDFVEVAANHA